MDSIHDQGVVDKSQFITAGVLGEGGFGKVLTGMMLKNGSWYAIKEIKKVRTCFLHYSQSASLSVVVYVEVGASEAQDGNEYDLQRTRCDEESLPSGSD